MVILLPGPLAWDKFCLFFKKWTKNQGIARKKTNKEWIEILKFAVKVPEEKRYKNMSKVLIGSLLIDLWYPVERESRHAVFLNAQGAMALLEPMHKSHKKTRSFFVRCTTYDNITLKKKG